jgi:hypothetical protein
MFDKMIVYEAIRDCQPTESCPWERSFDSDEQACLISLLIHDIFGGEILKTHVKEGWHFYNRIEGKRLDFTSPDMNNSSNDNQFEDIPSTPDETYTYFEDEEYSTFLMRFIGAFEEAIGLDRYRQEPTAS